MLILDEPIRACVTCGWKTRIELNIFCPYNHGLMTDMETFRRWQELMKEV